MDMFEQNCDYYAVNLFDLVAHMEPNQFTFVGTLLEPVLTDDFVYCEGKSFVDGVALRIRRDISFSQWIDVLSTIRNLGGVNFPANKRYVRIYQSKTSKGSWERI